MVSLLWSLKLYPVAKTQYTPEILTSSSTLWSCLMEFRSGFGALDTVDDINPALPYGP